MDRALRRGISIRDTIIIVAQAGACVAHSEETQVDFIVFEVSCRYSRRPSSWRSAEIRCTKEEAIDKLRAIRQQILASGVSQELFKQIAEKESDCSRWVPTNPLNE